MLIEFTTGECVAHTKAQTALAVVIEEYVFQCCVVLFQRIFGEAAEKNLYLSQLIILDTLEKCLAGVSAC